MRGNQGTPETWELRRPVRSTLRIPIFFSLAAIATFCAMPALAQNAAPKSATPDRVALERVSLGSARTALHRALLRLPFQPDLDVGTWVLQTPALDRGFRAWTRSQPWVGGPRIYSDGSCDVDVRVTPELLAKQLVEMRKTLDKRDPAESPTVAAIEAAARDWAIQWATGTASASQVGRGGQADGWEDISAEGVQLARLAAQADAAYAMLEEAGRLKVTSARRVVEFLNSSVEVRDAVAAALQSTVQFKSELSADQLCVAQGSIRIPDLIRILTQVHRDLYKGNDFQAADFREMAITNAAAEIRVSGLAAPPDKSRIRPEFEQIELDRPAWTETTLSATGRYEEQDGDDFPAEMRVELARWDGMDQLRKQVEALILQGDISVERFLGYRTALKNDVVLFLSAARLVNRPLVKADGGAEVRVELPLTRLWWILRRGATIVEVEPAEATSRPAIQSTEVEH